MYVVSSTSIEQRMDVADFECCRTLAGIISLVVMCPYEAQSSIHSLRWATHEGLAVIMAWQARWSPMCACLTLPLTECTTAPL